MKQKWYQSKAVWISIAALASFITRTWFDFEISDLDTFVNLLLAALVAFGIINNPTSKDTI